MKYVYLLIIIFSHNCIAEMISSGTFVPYLSRAQVNAKGDTKVFELNPYIGLGTQLHMSGMNYFMPEIGYSYFLNNPKNIRREQVFINYNFSRVLSDNFTFRYGITNNWYRIIGKGGGITLDNGDSKTTFPSPDKTVTSYYTTLNIGGEAFFASRNYGLRFDLQTMSFQKLENRAFNYLLTINFYR